MEALSAGDLTLSTEAGSLSVAAPTSIEHLSVHAGMCGASLFRRNSSVSREPQMRSSRA